MQQTFCTKNFRCQTLWKMSSQQPEGLEHWSMGATWVRKESVAVLDLSVIGEKICSEGLTDRA